MLLFPTVYDDVECICRRLSTLATEPCNACGPTRPNSLRERERVWLRMGCLIFGWWCCWLLFSPLMDGAAFLPPPGADLQSSSFLAPLAWCCSVPHSLLVLTLFKDAGDVANSFKRRARASFRPPEVYTKTKKHNEMRDSPHSEKAHNVPTVTNFEGFDKPTQLKRACRSRSFFPLRH